MVTEAQPCVALGEPGLADATHAQQRHQPHLGCETLTQRQQGLGTADEGIALGRQDALADLAQRFDAGARLVSLLGIGGTGKTRLSLPVAAAAE